MAPPLALFFEKFLKTLKTHNINALVVPSNDEFLNEYVPDYLNRLKALTGFTGSNGFAIIGNLTGSESKKIQTYFFTDGRYILQAKKELPGDAEVFEIKEGALTSLLKKYAAHGAVIGFDPMLHTENQLLAYQESFGKAGVTCKIISNLFAFLDEELPKPAFKKAFEHKLKYAGVSREDKIKHVTKDLSADYLLLTNPDSICWLLNVRGEDIPYNPILLSYLVLGKNGTVTLFTNPDKVRGLDLKVEVQPLEHIQKFLIDLGRKKVSLQLDPAKTPYWFAQNSGSLKIIHAKDPCELRKAVKNEVELRGFRECHKEDGRAVTRFACWLKDNLNNQIDEMQAADKLLEFRKEGKLFKYPSFGTISAYGSNAAIIHYQPNATTNKPIGRENLYLLDSGGQYENGTTDVTRTYCFGVPTAAHKKAYTLVLKGHIAIATARFPAGTTGAQLDALARRYLWSYGMDYAHGTGHGVGHFLSVHEGPQRIAKNAAINVPLKEGMILSNEPGFYKEGEFGIRIENLVVVVASRYEGFLEFETLTMVPIEMNLIDRKLLTRNELSWLKEYNRTAEQATLSSR